MPERKTRDYEYVIWHAGSYCDHYEENVCTVCDTDGWFRENYSQPTSVPGRGDRLNKKVFHDER